MVRAKLVVTGLKEQSKGSRVVTLDCRYDETIPEDQRFYSMTPAGHLEMLINNPAALDQLQLGKAFYVDLTPAE